MTGRKKSRKVMIIILNNKYNTAMKKTILYIIFIFAGIVEIYAQDISLGTITGDYTYKLQRNDNNAATTYCIGFTINKTFTFTAKEILSNPYFFINGYFKGTDATLLTGLNLNTSFTFPAGQYRVLFVNPNPAKKAFQLEITFKCQSCSGGTSAGTSPATNPQNILPNGGNYIKTTVPRTGKNAVTFNPDNDEIVSFQYFDGLGRPVEVVQNKFTPAKTDLVTLQDYDEFNRESYSWLPTPTTNTNGAFVARASVASLSKTAYSNDDYAYSKPVYEISPLNRTVQQYGPGNDWQTKGKSVKTDYLTNSTTYPCRNYSISGDNLVKTATDYADNILYVVRTTDEDSKIAYEFKDKLGRVLLQRQMDGNTSYDTYYVYDDFGNLRFVLPPMASDALAATITTTYIPTSNAALKDYAYIYKYDNRNRCIEKKLPGAEPVYNIYDKADQLVLYQDGELRSQDLKKWYFNKYDALGRVIMTGICVIPSGMPAASIRGTFIDNTVIREVYNGCDACYNMICYGYSENQYPRMLQSTNIYVLQVLTVNYYDDYRFKNLPYFGSNYNYQIPTGFDNKRYGTDTDETKTKGLLTGTISDILNNGNPNARICTVFYYDSQGRMIQSIASNHLSGYEKEYINYSFTGKPNWKQSIHTAILNSVTNTITETYSYAYDHADRPTTTKYKVNSDPDFATLSTLAYDDKGRLASKQQYGNAITTTYGYNIRNWLTSIKSGPFDETLYYNESYAGNTPQYNGNISAISWRGLTSNSIQGYRYIYDGLNRLKKGQYLSGTTVCDYFTEEVTQYNKNGNIEKMKRYALTNPPSIPSTGTLVDDLTLTYNGNQLSGITDASTSTSTIGFVTPNVTATGDKVKYDNNGNIKQNYYNGIAGITYNVLNLPDRIQSMYGHNTIYSYDASGVKRKMVHQTAKSGVVVPLGTTVYTPSASDVQSTLTTDYCANGHIIYENGVLKRILNPEGYATKPSNSACYFYAKDHLGNNRVVSGVQIPVPGVTAYGGPQQETNYYPFGMPFTVVCAPRDGYNPELQPYKFGGKEYDEMHGLNWYDFGARYYNGIVPMFTTIDPLAEKYYNISPYAYCLNNPVRYVDPKGKDVWDVLKGTMLAITDNMTGGAVNNRGNVGYSDADDFNLGQDLGDAISMVAGAYEFVQGAGAAVAGVLAAPETGGLSLSVTAEGAAVATHGVVATTKAASSLSSQKDRVSQANSSRGSEKSTNPKKEAREAGKEKRDNQPASEQRAKWKAKELEKAEGPDARRQAHDAKDKGAPDRTKQQIDEDYKINR